MKSIRPSSNCGAWDFNRTARNGVVVHTRTGKRSVGVFLIHCVGLDARMWLPMLPMISRDVTVHAVDVPGHGLSGSMDHNESLRSVSGKIAEAIRELTTSPLLIAGISMGGMIAQCLAIEDSNLAQSLILGDTSYKRDETSRAALLSRAAKVRRSGVASTVDETINRWFSESFREQAPIVIESVRAHLANLSADSHARTWEVLASLNLGSRVSQIRVPTSIIVGELDVSTTPSDMRGLARQIPNARYLELQGAGHLSALESPTEWAAEIHRRLTGT